MGILKEQAAMRKVWEEIEQSSPDIGIVWEDFLWSCIIWRSRRFMSRKHKSEVILPAIDLINASVGEGNASHVSTFEMCVTRGAAIHAGEEILHSYECSYKK